MARPGLRNHPKFRRLKKLLNLPAVYVEAHLEAMWKVGYENGNPVIGDESDVELAAEWEDSDRPPGEFVAAVVDCRLVDKLKDGRIQIHDLFDHAPEYVQGRAARELERSKDKPCHYCSNTYHSPDYRSMYCSERCKVAYHRNKMKPTVTDASVTVTDCNRQLPTVTDSYRSPAPAPAPAPAPVLNTIQPVSPPPSGDEEDDLIADRMGSIHRNDTPGFVRFWTAWPSHSRKKGRSKCSGIWKRKGLETIANHIIESLERWKVSPAWAKQDGEFMPGPEPWLNDEGWETPAEAISKGTNGHPRNPAIVGLTERLEKMQAEKAGNGSHK